MKPEPQDELLKSLVEETNALPRAAAAQARAQQNARRNTRRIVLVLFVALLSAGAWIFQHASPAKNEIATRPPEVVSPSPRQDSVQVQHVEETTEPNPVLTTMSEGEKKLLAELPGIPVLIVNNDAGDIARVHIFER